MENRPLSLLAGLIAWLLLGSHALAADSAVGSEQQADWAQRLEKAAALQAEGDARRSEAAKVLGEKNAACQKRFQVNACLKENENEYSAASRQAKHLSNEGLAMERAVRKEQLSERDALHDERAARRQAELPARQAETAAARQAAAEREAELRADRAKKAEAGLQRKAAAAEKLSQKEAAHNARVAEKMQKAQQRAAESGGAGK